MPTPLSGILALEDEKSEKFPQIRNDVLLTLSRLSNVVCHSHQPLVDSQPANELSFKMASHPYYELYRRSSIGLALIDSLDELVHSGRIEPQLAMKVIATFDKSITEVLADKVKTRLNFKGHLDTYRFCDEVWTFLIKDVSFKLDNQNTVQADSIKIVSCNAKRPGET